MTYSEWPSSLLCVFSSQADIHDVPPGPLGPFLGDRAGLSAGEKVPDTCSTCAKGAGDSGDPMCQSDLQQEVN